MTNGKGGKPRTDHDELEGVFGARPIHPAVDTNQIGGRSEALSCHMAEGIKKAIAAFNAREAGIGLRFPSALPEEAFASLVRKSSSPVITPRNSPTL